jgi:hypothetical protein
MATAAVDSGGQRQEAVSKGVEEHHSEVGAQFEVPGRGGAHRGWAVRGQLGVRGGAWRWWEAHRHRGRPGRWLDEEVIDELAVEEVAGGTGFGALRRLLTGRWLGVVARLAWLRGAREQCLMRFVDGSWWRGCTAERWPSGATEQDGEGESFARERRKYLAFSEV